MTDAPVAEAQATAAADRPPVAVPPVLGGEVTQPLPAPAGQPSQPTDREAVLTRRVPGAHLADELRLPGGYSTAPDRPSAMSPPVPAAPTDRDPAAEQRALDVLVAGFARGTAAVQKPATPPVGSPGPAPRQARNGQPGTTRNGPAGPGSAGQPSQHADDWPGDPSPTFQFDSGAPTGPEPQNLERR